VDNIGYQLLERRYLRFSVTRDRWRPIVTVTRSVLPYSAEAGQIIDQASQEAIRLQHNYIGTEHLLLGVLTDDGNSGRTDLEALDIDPNAVQQQVEEIIGTGYCGASERIAYTPRAMRVLELAARAALRAGADEIRGVHILAGLIAEGEGVAAQVLVRLGADRDPARSGGVFWARFR